MKKKNAVNTSRSAYHKTQPATARPAFRAEFPSSSSLRLCYDPQPLETIMTKLNCRIMMPLIGQVLRSHVSSHLVTCYNLNIYSHRP